MRVETSFPGGLKVEAHVRGFRITTDQPLEAGGDDTAPNPYELFLASLAACGGYFAVRFCRRRAISTDGMSVSVEAEKGPGGELESLVLDVTPPFDLPEKYRDAFLRAIDQCTVKRALLAAPTIETRLQIPAAALVA
jgi:putative redox protein